LRLHGLVPAVFLLLAAVTPICHGESHWNAKETFHIGGEGGWDYVTVDAVNHRLFVTRTTHTQAIDSDSGKVLGDVPGQKRSHGVALVPMLNRGFITDGGGSGSVVVFDLTSYQVLGRVPAVADVDGIIYDPKTDLVLAVSGDGSALFAFKPNLDPKNDTLGAAIPLPGKPEFLAADGAGRVYINLEDKGEVAAVDLASRSVVAQWPVAPGGHPVAMSIDPASHRLFIGCRNPQKLIVMNTDTGSVVSTIPIGAGVDASVFYDGTVFASCRDGSLISAREGPEGLKVDQTIQTPEGARTMGIDPTRHRIYLPTAEFEPSATGRPKPKSDTFMIVVVDQESN
jgi:DNA-binding beta-propeller fold protein YncE